jgi:hypothetical protein
MTLKWFSSYAPVDEEFDNVSLLLHGDGTNGSTTIVDSSSSPKAVTAVGDTQIRTGVADPFGNSIRGVIELDGTGDWLTAPISVSNFGTGDFTIELWIYKNDNVTCGIQEARPGGPVPWLWYFNGSKLEFYTGSPFQSTNDVPTGQWVHIAVTRASGVLRQFINGNKESENIVTVNLTTTGSSTLLMRTIDGNSDKFSGYIDEYRVTAGVARYTSNFTPPTAPFPDLSPSGRVTIEDNSLDVDARQYIINVEEQDGQPLESGVRTAINDFVVGCKSDGIWNAIKASCILAGARTLDGALVPLVGGAPTNFNFVGADYDRETGLVGDGSTKYLDSNRSNNADPQNNHHLGAFASSIQSNLALGVRQGNPTTGVGGRFIGFNLFRDVPNADTSQSFGSAVAGDSTFYGTSRTSSSEYVARIGGASSTITNASTTPVSGNLFVFAQNTTNIGPQSHTTSRLAFYSIGESLDLALLDTRVSNLITAIGAAIP